ncbi:MAG: YybH family protein, partial [Gammaproteobacteria bacterium]
MRAIAPLFPARTTHYRSVATIGVSTAPAARSPEHPCPRLICFATIAMVLALQGAAAAGEPSDPEAVLRALVKANQDKDLEAMARWMDAGEDTVAYTIQGRKYVGWPPFARDMEAEFKAVTRLEVPIKDLQVWTRGDVAWFAMELDYIRYVGSGGGETRTVMPLRETGVLERRHGRWILVSWHESFRHGAEGLTPAAETAPHEPAATLPDLSGLWAVQEEDKAYTATLDAFGNGTYTHQGGRLMTTRCAGRKWQGTWQQGGNDREGGFDLLISEDGQEARGVWWYTRVGEHHDIPPRQWGGT